VSSQYFAYPAPDFIWRRLVGAILTEQESCRYFDVPRM
jgi:hypothetical protein